MAYLKGMLWYLFAGSRGGENRARIVMALKERPYNANQLAQLLDLDYKTVRHHLDVLVENRIVVLFKEEYGAMYFLSEFMEQNFDSLKEIWVKIGKR